MTTYTNVFGGTVVYPSEVSYRAVTLTADTQLSWPTELATDTSVVAQIMDVTASAGPLKLKMPSAIDASVGETTLIFNVGSNAFTVTDTNANTIVSIAPGLAYQIYLTDNTTASGSWRSVQYGAGTSSATAGSLAGQGIKAIGTTLNQSMSVFTFSVNYTLGVASDRSALYVWTGGAGTISLPLASDAGNDWFVQVRNGGTGALTVDPAGVDLINGSSSLVLNPGDSAIVACSGTAWFTIGLGKSASFTFDYNSINLTGQPDPYTLAGANLNRIAYNFGGTLTANFTVIVPTTIQQYWVTNSTSGGFNITVKTASGTGISVAAGESAILYCDGVNVVDADTSGIAFPISVANGGTGATNATDARTNLSAAKSGVNADITSITALSAGGASGPAVTFAADPDSGMYSAGANQLGFSVNGVNAMTLTTSGMNLANALSVANGGTGTSTAFTTGSIVFAGASGVYSQDNANLFWDDTNNRLGIGTSSPSAPLEIYGASVALAQVSGDTNAAIRSALYSNNVNPPSVGFRKSRGTLASPAAVSSGDQIGLLNFQAFGGTTNRNLVQIHGIVDTYTSDSNISSYMMFSTSPSGSASATEKMRITAAGDVGIGTSSPATKLDVAGNLRFSAANPVIELNNGGPQVYTTAANTLQFATGGGIGTPTERMRIDSSGNVGIGTISPASKLEVSVPSTAAAAVQVTATSGTYPCVALTDSLGTSGVAGGASGTLILRAGGATTADNKVYILSSGNVGINASNPSEKLQIASGNLRLSDTYKICWGGTTNYVTGSNASNYLAFGTNNTEAVRVDSSGNVGIGTSSPANIVDIVHNQNAVSLARITNTDVGASARARLIVSNGTTQGGLSIMGTGASSPGEISFFNNSATAALVFAAGSGTERMRITAAGDVLVTGGGGLGYGTGSGGTVTQATSRTTGVTLNTVTGSITLVSAAGTATWQSFTVTNSTIAANDTVIVNQRSGTDLYMIHVTNVAAGSFQITFATTGGTTTEQPVFNFAVIKGATS